MRILLFSIVFFSFPLCGFPQWMRVFNNETDCFFVRDSVIYADGGLASLDSGATWASIPGGPLFATGVYAVTTNSDGSMIFVATDSGIYRFNYANSNWSNVLRPLYNYEFSVGYFDGYLFANDSGAIIRSSDFGDHWQRYKSIIPSNFGIHSYSSFNNYLFAGTDSGSFRSADSGKLWVKIDKGFQYTPVTFNFIMNEDTIFELSTAAAFQPASASGIFASVNNGEYWDIIDTGLSREFVCLISDGTNFFGGISGTFGGVFHSMDHGRSWAQIGFMERVLCLAITGDYILAGTTFGIYRARLSDFGINSVHQTLSPSKFIMFPNPITKSADFQFDTLQEPMVFELFDALGRSLLRRELPAGQASLHVDMQAFPAGIYFARLGGESVKVIKM